MNNKLFFLRAMLIAVVLGILFADTILWLKGIGQQLEHRNALLICVLLWFASLFYTHNSDDDWAGEF
ncbi:hypothetical protein FO440_22640 [Mucilaginibacter corticis]|uniref:Uncharacterized protein n=1 Tax=Mucilaginibacter corticis TaxID=2597670 RepID=A0A556M9X3_9SPHI|nr:hypothetical protein [Mucilaginibacter corticis]TSJ36628.1 hypothetical protein FO440_22640 [Mucilaginibacter corticis]